MWRRKREQDLQRELDAHLDLESEEQGDRYAARRQLGNLAGVKEDVREAWGWMWLERLGQDLRYALRMARHNPGFTATAVLSLALGIGANTAIFSLIDVVMLRWLPGVANPQELLLMQMQPLLNGNRPLETFSYPIVQALAEQKEIFAGVCGFSVMGFSVGTGDSATPVSGAVVTGTYYETLGVTPFAGRLITREDDQPGAPPVAVIGYGYWERQFARDSGIIGQPLLVNGVAVTIVGISPPAFAGAMVGRISDVSLPVSALPHVEPTRAMLLNPGNFWLRVLARPRQGVSMAQAKSRLEAIWPQISERVIRPDWPATRKKAMAEASFLFTSGATGFTPLRQMFRQPLLILMAVVALVLLIACANVANLMLARATAREREIAVRLAIGAGRARVVRQLLTESLLLATFGATAGVGLAWVASRFLLDAFTAGIFTVTFDLTPNWHILTFTAAVAVAAAVLFGLAPALQGTAARPSPGLKETARITRSRSRLLSTLMTAQVAISLVLVVGAGLFLRTLQNLQNLDPGFQREGVLLADADARKAGYAGSRVLAFYSELTDRIRQIPGVALVSVSDNTPLSGGTWTEKALPEGQPLPEDRDNAIVISAGPRYFETMQTPLLRGREFNEHDDGTPSVAIVSEAYANNYFPHSNPVGEHIRASITKPPADLEIVGVAKDTLTEGLRRTPYPTVYISYLQREPATAAFEIRVRGPLSPVRQAVKDELHRSLPDTAVSIRGLNEQVETSIRREQAMAMLAGVFGGLALLLACIGVYGLLAYHVARRTKEVGIRMALGGSRGGVTLMVMRSSLRFVILGVALGLPAAWAASRLIESMLFRLKPTDPPTIAGAALLLTASALLAAYLPARRASRIDPMAALRHE